MTRLFSTANLTALLSSLLRDLLSLCSFFACRPLILACFLLLSPHLLKLTFFLYVPLLFSASLLLLALLTASSPLRKSPSSSSDFPGSTCSAVLDEAKAGSTEQLCPMVLAAGDYSPQLVENDAHSVYFSADFKENYSSEQSEENECSEHVPEEAGEEEGVTNTTLPWRKEHRRGTSGILRRDGSARKEKEWKRTLACKLFEERMADRLCKDREAVEGAEGMDLLWEAYEVDAGKSDEKQRRKEWKRTLACKLFEERMADRLCKDREAVEGAEGMDLLWEAYEVDAGKSDEKQRRKEKKKKQEEVEDDEYGKEGLSGRRPCCLKALRLSAGKMNLGMGRPSLVKVSMALKVMSLFHPVARAEE